MRAPRLFHPEPLAAGLEVELDAVAAAHAVRVLRLARGAPLTLFDGRGGEFAATLVTVGKRSVTARVGARQARDAESPLAVTLAQGLARGERMDLVIQKAVELGVAAVVPVATARSVVRLDAERGGQRVQHWAGVVRAACEQCGRNRLPSVEAPASLDALLARPRAPEELRLVLDPTAGRGLRALERPGGPILLLVGPEGGLESDEVARAVAAGFERLALGPRVLRTETAGLAALAAIQALWGDLG